GFASVHHAEESRHLRSLSSITDVHDQPRQCPKRQHGWNSRNQDQIGRKKDILTQYREARRTIQQDVRIPAAKLLEHFSKVTVGPAESLEIAVELAISEVRRQEVEVIVVGGFDGFGQRIDLLQRVLSEALHLWMHAESEARRRLGIE